MCLTSCEGTLDDIFGEWSRPTGNNGNTKTTVAVKSVTLDETTLTKAVGDDAVTLTATVDPSDASDKTVTWKSSDASIATVDANGKVTFVAAGSTSITATATNGTEDAADDKTATCEVTISAKKVNVESVKLDQPTLTATVGDAAVTLTATVTPDDATDKTVKWTSSNESVATVADGVVTFVAAGTATITATAPNGTDDTADDKTAKCAVTVNAAAVPVTSVKLDKAVVRIYKYASSLLLTATVSPDDATDKTVTWKSSDENVATVNASGKVIPKKAGTTTITATANDGSGMKAASTVYVYDKIVDINTETANVTVYAGESWLIKGNATLVAKSINIGDGASATLLDVFITQPITCSATATIILADGSTNTVDASGINDKAAIQIGGTGKTLTIDAETAGDGTLTAKGGSDGAGIGTNKDETGGNIVINGGKVTATGGDHAAGIGTGNADNLANECGSITINGGTVTAKGGSYGAGIGTGCAYNLSNTCGAITINGGTVTATGGHLGAGIGTGWANNATNTCGAITIDTGVTSVTATKGTGIGIFNSIGTGLKGGGTQTCGTITIGGEVKAQSEFTGATYTYEP